MLHITRHPASLEHALDQHQELCVARADFERTHGECNDTIGTNKIFDTIGTNKIFVFPDEYSSVIAESQRQKLGRHHVVVSKKLLPEVLEVIRKLPHKDNVRVKEQRPFVYFRPAGESLVIRGTFLDTVMHPSSDLRSVASC